MTAAWFGTKCCIVKRIHRFQKYIFFGSLSYLGFLGALTLGFTETTVAVGHHLANGRKKASYERELFCNSGLYFFPLSNFSRKDFATLSMFTHSSTPLSVAVVSLHVTLCL